MTTSRAPSATAARTRKRDLATLAARAAALLEELARILPIDDAIVPRDFAATKVTSRVPRAAMEIAAETLAESPADYPQFDAAEARAALDYDDLMAPVAAAARSLFSRIERSRLKRRTGTAQRTLALYAMMKGAARLPRNEETRARVKEMAQLLTTAKKSTATNVTQTETKQMVRLLRSQKLAKLADHEVLAAEIALKRANAELALKVDYAFSANTTIVPAGSATTISRIP